MSERTIMSITTFYVLLNERYFSFQDSITTPHDECCRRVFESEAYREPNQGQQTQKRRCPQRHRRLVRR